VQEVLAEVGRKGAVDVKREELSRAFTVADPCIGETLGPNALQLDNYLWTLNFFFRRNFRMEDFANRKKITFSKINFTLFSRFFFVGGELHVAMLLRFRNSCQVLDYKYLWSNEVSSMENLAYISEPQVPPNEQIAHSSELEVLKYLPSFPYCPTSSNNCLLPPEQRELQQYLQWVYSGSDSIISMPLLAARLQTGLIVRVGPKP